MLSRRDALKSLAATGVGLPLLGAKVFAAETKISQPGIAAFQLGVATVSLKGLPLANALAAVHRVGLDRISLHRAHLPWESSPEAWRAVVAAIKAAGITVACCGVIYLKNDETAMRRMMEYVTILGVPLFSCSPEPAALPLLERLLQEYNLRAAIHNHGPEDKVWPSAASVLQAIEPRDSRIGLCLDVGHSYRAGEDPAEVIRKHYDRIYDMHIKDSAAEIGHEDIPIEMGRGKLDLAAVIAALIAAGYRENVWFEYEKDPNDPVTGLAESVGFVRGLIKGLNAS